MREIELDKVFDVAPRLGPDQLQLVAVHLDKRASCLGTDTDPVDAARDGKGAIGFDRDREALGMQRGDQRIVDLQHRLAASQHDIAVRVAPSPGFGYHRRERRRIDTFSAYRAVGRSAASSVGTAGVRTCSSRWLTQ